MNEDSHELESKKIDPLVGIASLYIEEACQINCTPEIFQQALATLRRYTALEISYDEAASICQQTINTVVPVDRIRSILKIAFNNNQNITNIQIPPVPLKMNKRCRIWTHNEDVLLLAGIRKYGIGDWRNISDFVGCGKTRSQCSQRWSRALNPSITKNPWTEAEDRQLLRIISKQNNKDKPNWSKISREIGTRSDVQCRYRYVQLSRTDSHSINDKKSNKANKNKINESTKNEAMSLVDLLSRNPFNISSCEYLLPPIQSKNHPAKIAFPLINPDS